ncbi:hypothetical protein [Geomicrobium sp. JCM 19038]|uniref:hypothetical protein n=1 Tax=Geomicrobium sp. JCM 19038 TaxID=1460635 RepID=UPI00045F2B2F|nr:hypothetical protein [Geomicrobium sp. JCM 19038]GAK09045.1 hypothetical protein JCM19038_2858 [Geomicrobium sp. JCM 19038]
MNWFTMQRRDKAFLIVLFGFITLFMLPWTHSIYILNISLLAWAAYFGCVFMPLIALVITFEKSRNVAVSSKEEVDQ